LLIIRPDSRDCEEEIEEVDLPGMKEHDLEQLHAVVEVAVDKAFLRLARPAPGSTMANSASGMMSCPSLGMPRRSLLGWQVLRLIRNIPASQARSERGVSVEYARHGRAAR
jgi:hypothetical protein